MNGSIRPISLSLLLIALLGISCQEKQAPPPPSSPTPTPTPVPPPTAGTVGCNLFFDNWNTVLVRNGAVGPVFTIKKGTGAVIPGTDPPQYDVGDPSVLCAIETYHWNDGAGKVPGKIGLRNKTTGETYPPLPATGWDATGIAAPSGEKNVNWQVLLNPRVELKPGDYEVIDSDPSTWSWNNTSMDKDRPAKAAGFTKVWLANAQ